MIKDIWGTTPLALTLRLKIRPYPARPSAPSCTLAPAESLMPTMGAPAFFAISMMVQIFWECMSPKAAAHYRGVLGKGEDRAAVHLAVAGHHPVAGHVLGLQPKVAAGVVGQQANLYKGVLVKQVVQAFPCGELALGVLPLDALGPASQAMRLVLLLELCDEMIHDPALKSALFGDDDALHL